MSESTLKYTTLPSNLGCFPSITFVKVFKRLEVSLNFFTQSWSVTSLSYVRTFCTLNLRNRKGFFSYSVKIQQRELSFPSGWTLRELRCSGCNSPMEREREKALPWPRAFSLSLGLLQRSLSQLCFAGRNPHRGIAHCSLQAQSHISKTSCHILVKKEGKCKKGLKFMLATSQWLQPP